MHSLHQEISAYLLIQQTRLKVYERFLNSNVFDVKKCSRVSYYC